MRPISDKVKERTTREYGKKECVCAAQEGGGGGDAKKDAADNAKREGGKGVGQARWRQTRHASLTAALFDIDSRSELASGPGKEENRGVETGAQRG